MYLIFKHLTKVVILMTVFICLFTGCPNSYSPSSSPTIFSSDQVIVEYSNWLKDGAATSWKLDSGTYKLEMTANNDGAVAEWVGGNCAKTQPMRELNMTCEMPRSGQLIITNPTTFGLGKSVSVTVKVTKLSR